MKAPCQQCKGRGYHEANIFNLGTREWVDSIVTCMHPTCVLGFVELKDDPRHWPRANPWEILHPSVEWRFRNEANQRT